MKVAPSLLFQNYLKGKQWNFLDWSHSALGYQAFNLWLSSLASDASGTKVKGLSLTWASLLRSFPTGYMEIQCNHSKRLVLKGAGEHMSDQVKIQLHSWKNKSCDPPLFLHLDRMCCHLKCELVTQPPCVSVSSSVEWR